METIFNWAIIFFKFIVFKIVSKWEINIKITIRKIVAKIVLVDAFILRM